MAEQIYPLGYPTIEKAQKAVDEQLASKDKRIKELERIETGYMEISSKLEKENAALKLRLREAEMCSRTRCEKHRKERDANLGRALLAERKVAELSAGEKRVGEKVEKLLMAKLNAEKERDELKADFERVSEGF
jgi:hypothetical protein